MNNQKAEFENMENQNQEYCSQCPKHCPKSQLQCGRGRNYFDAADNGGFRKNAESMQMNKENHEYDEHQGYQGHQGHGRGAEGEDYYAGCGDRHCTRDRKGKVWHPKSDGEHSLTQLLIRCGYIAGRKDGRQRGQGRILHILSHHPGMSQKELQETLGVEAGSLSEIIGKLESKGLLERKKDEQDRRRMVVQLTESGKEHMSESMKDEGQEEDIFQILNQDEQQKLKEILEKLLYQWKEERGQNGRWEQHSRHGHGRRHGNPHESEK